MSNLIRQYNMIITEIPMEINKVGIVTLVGIADKLTESTEVPAIIIINHSTKLFPDKMMSIAVKGMMPPIYPKIENPIHFILLGSCKSHQFKNLEMAPPLFG